MAPYRLLLLVVAGASVIAGCNTCSGSNEVPRGNLPREGFLAGARKPPKPAATSALAPGELVGGSCDSRSEDSECSEITVKTEDDKAKSKESLQKFCMSPVAPAACTASERVGTCRAGTDTIHHYYSGGPKHYTADDAKKECARIRGQWVTP